VSQYEVLCDKASVAYREHRHYDALECFIDARRLDGSLPVAWNGIAAVLADIGRLDESVSILVQATEATGNSTTVLANLATLLERQGRYDESIKYAEQVLVLEPIHADARLTLGLALLKQGRFQDSTQQFQLLTNRQPENTTAFLNLGEALLASDQYLEASIAYKNAIALSPDNIPARVGCGQALAMLRRFDEAEECFADAMHVAPEEATACFRRMAEKAGQRIPLGWRPSSREALLSQLWRRQQHCEWHSRVEYLSVMRQYAAGIIACDGTIFDPSLAFQSLFAPIPTVSRSALIDAVARGIAAAAGPVVRRRLVRPPGQIRIGFLSPNFREHPSAQLNWRLLALLDRTSFKVFGYSLRHSDGALRDRIIQSCEVFRDVSALNGWEIAKRIALDGIDILVDLAGHLDYSRPEVLALHPAPLRVSYLGSPGSMGAELVDYRITDHYVTPAKDAVNWSERLVFLPTTVAIYNNQEVIASNTPSRAECFLPDNAFVYCCFNASYKIEPEVFAVWMRLLARVPNSVLWLLDTGEPTKANLRREAISLGIAPERLVFAPRMPRAEHLARHICADLFIDTFYCGAMATAGDALWAGLPVLTCSGDNMAARMSGTIVRATGLPELVVTDRDAYAATAFRLATRPDELAALREKLAQNRTSCALFDTEQRVRDLGQAFTMMWERHATGLPPASFDVPGSDLRA
jgi:protein O-GlcNAc transferase